METEAEQPLTGVSADTRPRSAAAAVEAVDRAVSDVPARLKAVRTRRGMTLVEVAEQTGISKSTLSRLETGQRRPTLELLLALSVTYRVPLDDLVGGAGSR